MTMYMVKEGFTVSTKRGAVKSANPVTVADFTHGQDAIDDLVKKGHLLEVKAEVAKKKAE